MDKIYVLASCDRSLPNSDTLFSTPLFEIEKAQQFSQVNWFRVNMPVFLMILPWFDFRYFHRSSRHSNHRLMRRTSKCGKVTIERPCWTRMSHLMCVTGRPDFKPPKLWAFFVMVTFIAALTLQEWPQNTSGNVHNCIPQDVWNAGCIQPCGACERCNQVQLASPLRVAWRYEACFSCASDVCVK